VDEFLSSSPFALTTKKTYARILNDLAAQSEIQRWTACDLLGFIQSKQWGNSRQCVALAASQRFLRWRFGEHHAALAAKLKRVRPRPQRVLTIEKALELLASFDTSCAKGARDLAIAALALDTGLRCSELCRLRITDIDLDNRRLSVIVKGGQWGFGVFSEQTSQYIREWIAFRKGSSEALFVSTRTWTQLVPGGLQKIVEGWGLSIGIKLSPHDLRRSFATLATIFGAPSRMVQVAGRWSDISMVERYTRSLQLDIITPYLPVSQLVGARTNHSQTEG